MEKKYKPVFGELYKDLNNHLKKTSKELPCRSIKDRTQEFLDSLENILQKEKIDSSQKKMEVLANTLLFYGFIHDLNKELPHVFVQNEVLIDFFKNAEFNDFSLLKLFTEENDKPFVENKFLRAIYSVQSLTTDYTPGKNLLDTNVSYFALHSKDKSYFISTSRNVQSSKNISLTVWDSDNAFSHTYIDDTKEVRDFLKKDELIKIGLNFLSYCKAFPECLIEGVPQTLSKDEKNKIRHAQLLNTATQIIENIEDIKSGKSVIPHFRKGHFRLLQDERFKNKKGQVVFVKATMVKGQAKTLEKKDNYERGM